MDYICYLDGNANYKERLKAAAATKPARINVQALDHDTAPKDAVKLWLKLEAEAARLGLNVDLEVQPVVGKNISGVVLAIVKVSIEGTIRKLAPKVLNGRKVLGKEMNGSAKRRRSYGRSGARASVEVDATDTVLKEHVVSPRAIAAVA